MALLRTLINQGKQIFRGDVAFQRVIFNSGWLLSSSTLTSGLTFVQGIIVARSLGVEQFGILTLITTYTTSVNQFVDSRVWETAIKFITQYREQGDFAKATATVKLCYAIDAATGGLAFMFLLLTADLAARFFVKEASTVGLIELYALSVVISIPFGTSSALLRIANRFDWQAYVNSGEAVLRLFGILMVVVLGYGLREILLVYLASKLASILILLALSKHLTQKLNLLSWRQTPLSLLRNQYRRVLSFTFYSNLGATSRLITSKADILILGLFSTPTTVGLYKLAKQLSGVLIIVINPIYTAIYPELSKLVEQGKLKEIGSLQRKLSMTITAVVLPLGVLFTIAIVWIIPLAFGDEFVDSILLAQIMVWQVVWTPLIWFPSWLLSLERTRLLAGLNWADAVLYSLLLFFLVLLWGSLGAALATLFRYVGWTIMASMTFVRIQKTLPETLGKKLEGKTWWER